MFPKDRRNWILQQLERDGKIDVDQLANQLNVSSMTIRRDLTLLQEENKVIRTYGGAVLPKPLIVETSHQSKEEKFIQEKRQIAKKAAELVQDYSTILLDSGTTTLELARCLKEQEHLTIVTNDIKISAELMNSPLKVIVLGGELQNHVGALLGSITQRLLAEIHVDLFILGAHAVHQEAGITAPTFEKAMIKKQMIQAAETTWLITDSSKFAQKSFSKVCDLDELDGLVTDNGIPREYQEALHEKLDVVIAKG